MIGIKKDAKVVFKKDFLLKELIGGLQSTADMIAAAGEIIKKQFPEKEWGINFLMTLAQNKEAADYLMTRIRMAKADELELECNYKEVYESRLTAEQKDNRRFVGALVVKDLAPLKRLVGLSDRPAEGRNFTSYIRLGAIYIESGETIIAENAHELLESYCSVTAETKNELAFVETVEAMKATAATLKKHHEKLAGLAIKDDRRDIMGVDYLFDRLKLASGIRLSSGSATWRALLTYVVAHRKNDTPRFYNYIGIPERLDVEQVYKITGYLPKAEPALRLYYPELYKDIPFSGECCNGMGHVDSPAGVAEVRADGYRVDRWGHRVAMTTRFDRKLVLDPGEVSNRDE